VDSLRAMLAGPALDRGARAGRRPGAVRRALRAVAVVGAHDLDAELDLAGDLGLAGAAPWRWAARRALQAREPSSF